VEAGDVMVKGKTKTETKTEIICLADGRGGDSGRVYLCVYV
jgi:hypothetical protein